MYTNSWYHSVKALASNNFVSLPLHADNLLSMIREKGFSIIPFSSDRDTCIENLTSHDIEIPSQIAYTISISDFQAVYYNNTLPSDEIVFALAHEYGHICLSPSAFHGILGKSENPVQEFEQEREADDFALNLLAPICVLSKLKPRTISELQKLTLLNSSRAYIAYKNLKNPCTLSEDEELVTRNFQRFIRCYNLKKYRKLIATCILFLSVVLHFYFSNFTEETHHTSWIDARNISSIASSSVPASLYETIELSPVPTDHVVVTPSGARYHIPDCFHVESKTNLRKLSVTDAALEGFTPCKDCCHK